MKTNWIAGLVLLALVVLPQPDRPLPAAEPLQPGDPIAAVDGQAIYLGELNLVLTERIAAADLDRVGDPVKQATALLLVRRRLAMNALREQGGEALQASVQRHLEDFADEARRRGTSLDQLAQARRATEQAMRTDLAWKSAWSQYLKSRMTEANLRRYFDSHSE